MIRAFLSYHSSRSPLCGISHNVYVPVIGFRVAQRMPAALRCVQRHGRQGMKNFRRKRGFERASNLVAGRVRTASETRGFAVSRLLTHWDDIIGADLCGMARPVDITYGKSFGATLTLLIKGAEAPM